MLYVWLLWFGAGRCLFQLHVNHPFTSRNSLKRPESLLYDETGLNLMVEQFSAC